MNQTELETLISELITQPQESEWVEFKLNFHSFDEIGRSISALANGACLFKKSYGYLVFGVKDSVQTVEGTTFRPHKKKKGNEELEHWLAQRLDPRIDFRIFEFEYQGKNVVIFRIPEAESRPVLFMQEAYIRVGSITRKLKDFPSKERKIWLKKPHVHFEDEIALQDISSDDVVRLLDTQAYYDLLRMPYPATRKSVLDKFESERFINRSGNGYSITNLGAILFAKNVNEFANLARKAVRVIIYKGNNRTATIREQTGVRGYAIDFEGLINYINSQLPANEEIGKAFRQDVRMYPEIAIRELVANALIHQDFAERGTSPMVEIFSDRIEFTNPGLPLITPMRFIDEYQSRNEFLASFLRRIGICEEKGSGIDKVIFQVELYQLPAPDFIAKEKHTKIIMYAFKELNKMDKKDKIRACYQHASRIIRDTLEAELIKEDDPDSKSRKYAKYIPFWA